MLRYLLINILCYIAVGLDAQLSLGHSQGVQPLHKLGVEAMPTINNKSLLENELYNHQNGRPVHFAHPFDVDINPSQSGHWEYLNDSAIWRIVIESPTAHSVNLGFSEFYLPQGGALFIYDFYAKMKTNAFTPADNEEHEQLWTPIIASDKIVIEVNIPKDKIEELKLQLSYVNHDFLDIQKSSTGSCHIDVNCAAENGYPEIGAFRNQIRSVGLFTLSGTSVCSGFLVNNTRQDCTPYFMTAFHCNLNQSNAPSIVTYWNYENSTCRTPGSIASAEAGDGRFESFNSGATWRAGWRDSDFVLVEFDDEVPQAAKAYFAGWDINNNPPDRAVMIHHPNLEEKRISFAEANLFTGIWGLETAPIPNGNHLVLDHWDQGSTEEGSSGAPLFNRQGLVVGQLHGGLASCENQEYDAFGRLFSSWTGGGTPSTRLKDWLDPDGTGRVQLPGKNCIFDISLSENNISKCASEGFFSIDIQVDDSFLGQVEMTFEGLPNGASAFYSESNVFAGQVTTLTVANLNNLAAGEYVLDIVADNGQNRAQKRLLFDITTQGPSQTVLLSPELKEAVNIQDVTFEWMQQTIATNYEFQISENENLFPLLLEETTSEANLSLNITLTANQNYYWRVRALNTCAPSPWSPIFVFNTVDLACVVLSNTETQIIDISEPSILCSNIQNDSRGLVQGIVVKNIFGEHDFVSDLKFTLQSPSGTEVLLMNRKCSSYKDFNLGFSDTGTSEIICPPTNGSLYKSEQLLANFIGESAQGEWTLKVEDVNKFDGGVLQGWTIEICTNPSIDFSISIEEDSIEICANESISIPFQLGSGYDTSTDIVLETNHDSICSILYVDGQGILNINSNEQASAGTYTIRVQVNDESGNSSTLEVFVNIIGVPSEINLLLPLNNAQQVDLNPNFSWDITEFADTYDLALARDFSFTDLIFSTTLMENVLTLNESLAPGQEYYWRVSAQNSCGVALSPSSTFTTENTNSASTLLSESIEVYPNPSDQILNVLLPTTLSAQRVDISISTIDGQQVMSRNDLSTAGHVTLDVQAVPAGMYILSVRVGGETFFSKVVVQ